jgi:hypothetical protein
LNNASKHMHASLFTLTLLHLFISPFLDDNSDAGLIAIGKNLPKLNILRLYAVAHYSDMGVISMARGCPLLHTLDLCGAHSVCLMISGRDQ